MASIEEQSWESFSAPWNVDVKLVFELGRAVLAHPLTHLALVTAPALFAEQTPTKLKTREPASEAGDAIARLTELRATAGRTAAS